MSRGGGTGTKKDVLLELVSRDIKELQRVHSENASSETKAFTEAEEQAQLLCDHLDHILMHGLREFEDGYWPFVSYFTRTELVQKIRQLRRVTTSVGRGRSWLYTALNEQSVESYIRMFAENQDIVEGFYLRDAFIRDMEHILLLLTLVSGLDFISFDLQVDCDYLDYGVSILSSKITSHTSSTEVTPTFLSAKVIGESGRPRTHSDPTPKPPGAIPSLTRGARKQTRNNKETPAAGTEKSRETSGETGTNVENENGDNSMRNEGAGDSIPIPSTEEPRSSMMSSSLQMTSSRNLLERMSSLETRSPFLERAAGSREGLRWRGVGQSGRGERVKDENGEEDDMVVAKGRRSGRSKKRRRKRNEENEVSDESSPRGHVTREENHVTREESHVIPGAVLFSPSNTTTTADADNSVPVGAPHSTRTEECDYETEPVVLQSAVEEKGLGLSLEMELALAARDVPGIQTRVSSGDAGGGDQLELHLPPSCDAAPSETPRGHLENFEESLPHTSGSSNRNPFDVEEDADLSPSLSPSTPPSSTDKNRDIVSNRQHRSYRIHHPPSSASARSEFKSDEKRNPRQVPLNSKPISSSSRSPPSAQHRSKSRRQRGVTPEMEGEFDIITRSEVRALDGQRSANALYSEDREGETEEGEGDLATVGKMVYHEPPQRPKTATEEDKRACDVRIDETMRVVFSIDIFLPVPEKTTPPPPPTNETSDQPQLLLTGEKRESQGPEEEAKRLVQVNTPCGLGQYRPGYVLVTTEAVYLLRRDGIEGILSREFGARYKDMDHLVIGLGWQSMELVYRERESEELRNCILVTGSEAVSRSLMESIETAASQCPGFMRVIPRNRDDETHWDAIERELIKLGSETSMDRVQYSLVSWEQVKGSVPDSAHSQTLAETASGLLYFKKNSRVGLSSWKQGFFRLIDGTLHQFGSEADKLSKATFSLAGCGGVTRVASTGDSRQFVLSLSLAGSQPLLLATGTEEELTQWQMALCEAVLQVQSSDQCKNPMCTVLLTKEKVHILQEDMSRGLVHHITCCEVTAIEKISVDRRLPLYCTVSYDDGEYCKGVWLLCFSSEFELGKFETALAELWKDEFQIDLPFSELEVASIIQRARHTVDLMTSTSLRSDSITKGRTEFTYSSTF